MKRIHVSLVLHAIALIEGWDGPHSSIQQAEDGGWKLNHNGDPEPSKELLDQIEKCQTWASPMKPRRQSA
jgi:hypothetical protein